MYPATDVSIVGWGSHIDDFNVSIVTRRSAASVRLPAPLLYHKGDHLLKHTVDELQARLGEPEATLAAIGGARRGLQQASPDAGRYGA